ncbi:MAG: hypothetical protein KBC41_04025 [Candidatus Pacebacteria bacterium]|nr:hypothetical protein [Candidatus Paceibacterota bacterium]MBP9867212.1 hypothetical protein [Candidatus Paceibacterota bacterium]
MAKHAVSFGSTQENGHVVELFGKEYSIDQSKNNNRGIVVVKKEKLEDGDEVILKFSPCVVCGNTVSKGYYGHWGNGGTCSKTCEIKKERETKYL